MSGKARPCDYCGQSTALLYCRADSAKLCLSCDREVHSTNQLFSKHIRTLLCDSCDHSPATILCSTKSSVLCQNCDWETHNPAFSSLHDCRPKPQTQRWKLYHENMDMAMTQTLKTDYSWTIPCNEMPRMVPLLLCYLRRLCSYLRGNILKMLGTAIEKLSCT